MSSVGVLNTKTSENINNPQKSKMLKYQNIAPAPNTTNSKILTPRILNAPYGVDQTQSVARRNARERNRVKQVNNSFAKLRQHIPQYVINDLTKSGGRGPHKKISKVDTLRIAVEYIRRLQDLVEDLNGSTNTNLENKSTTNENIAYNSNSATPSPTPLPTLTYPSVKQLFSYTGNPASPLPTFEQTKLHTQQQQQLQTLLPIPNTSTFTPLQTQFEQTCHSPTSSFNSSMSFDSGHFEATQQLSPTHSSPNNTQLQLKYEHFNNYNLQEENCNPDDEEILDYISLWQDQQS